MADVDHFLVTYVSPVMDSYDQLGQYIVPLWPLWDSSFPIDLLFISDLLA
jgi:hypothetical protein